MTLDTVSAMPPQDMLVTPARLPQLRARRAPGTLVGSPPYHGDVLVRARPLQAFATLAALVCALAAGEAAHAKGREGLLVCLNAPTDVRTAYGVVRVRAGEVLFQSEASARHECEKGERAAAIVRTKLLRSGILDRRAIWNGVVLPAGTEVRLPRPDARDEGFDFRPPGRYTLHGLVFEHVEVSVSKGRRHGYFKHIKQPASAEPTPDVLDTFAHIEGRLADAATIAVGTDTLSVAAGTEIEIEPARNIDPPRLTIESARAITLRPGIVGRRAVFDLLTGALLRVGLLGPDGTPSGEKVAARGFTVMSHDDIELYPTGEIREIAPAFAVSLGGHKLGLSGYHHPPILVLWPSGAPQCASTGEEPALLTFVDARTGEVVKGLYPSVHFDLRGQPRIMGHFSTPGLFLIEPPAAGSPHRRIRPVGPGHPLNEPELVDKLDRCGHTPAAVVDWLAKN